MTRRRSTTLHVCAGALILLAGVLPVAAQTATVQGRVTDPTGAVAPGAKITITNARSGVKSTTTSNTQGAYTMPFLQPGTYDILVKSPGFKPALRSGVALDVDQTAGIDFALQVGEASQTVEVQGGAPLLQTETASLGQTIDNKTLFTLPLNGRDYTQLVTLGAGAVQNTYSRAKNGFSLNGSETFQNTMLLDGVDNNNYILGTDSGNINALTPSVDAIQQFKVETSNYSAQYGRSAGGVVSVSIKSGTNEIHGDAFEFLRNDALDANDFFANRTGLARPPLRRNQFGGTVGGPVIKNRSFFFLSYQGTRQTSSNSGATTAPTPAMVGGNFGSKAIYDPFSLSGGVRAPFPNNVIPANLFDPSGAKLAALYPAPNLPGLVNNYAYNQTELNNGDELDSRFDEQLTNNDTMFVRYSRGTGEIDQGSVFHGPGNGGGGFGQYPIDQPLLAYSIVVSETHIFGPALVNEFHIGYTHNESNQLSPATSPLFQQFGINGIPPLAGLDGLPQIGLTAFSALGDRTFAPNPKLVQVGQLNDTMSWIHGNHTVTYGGQVLLSHDYAGTSNGARGSLSFNGQFTSQVPGKGAGSALADLLLGQTNSAGLTTPLVGRLRDSYYGLFINDSWRVNPKLTLNFGVRYDLQTPLWERDNRMASFDFFPGSPGYGTLIDATSGSFLARTFSNLDTNNFAPRLGLAYQLDSKTVIRGAYGVFYGGLGYQDIAHSGSANPPYFMSVSAPSATSAPLSNLVLSQGFPPGLLSTTNLKNPNLFALSPQFPMPMVNQWNFAVERQLPGDSVLTVSYVGSSTSHLMGDNNINSPPPGPGAINPRRGFPQYGDIIFQTPYGHATYEALQATFQKRYSSGLSILADYTWSHAMDNVLNNEDNVGGGVPQNPLDWALEKADSGFDVPQHFVASVIYQLPVGAQGKLLGGSRVSRAVFGGWQVGGIFVDQSGFPLTPTVSPNPSNTTTPARPNRVCNGNLSGSAQTLNQWFQVSCFAPAAPYTYGNSARGVIRSPGMANLDALVDRNFTLTERMNLEFRSEFFNFTNSAHFGRPDMVIGTPQAGRITSDIAPNREIQFALRLMF